MEAPLKQNFIKEGQVEIDATKKKVFYNPVQEFNRDLSIAVLNTFTNDLRAEKIAKFEQRSKNQTQHLSDNENVKNEDYSEESEYDVTILDALSATGLRAIRYAKEVQNVSRIVANDLSEQAVETIKANVVHNKVENIINISHSDACMLMYKHKYPAKRFSAIDLDPYGCPSIFLDAAVQSVQDGGLLLVTATDMAVLAGTAPETCYSKYGAISLKTKCCHEMALRILLQCIEEHANKYSRYIKPVLSISADFYIRVFVKVYSGAVQCEKTLSKLSMVYNCVGCDNITLQPLAVIQPNPSENNPNQTKVSLPIGPPVDEKCIHCNQGHRLGGPIWSAPIHDVQFVSRVLADVESNSWLYGTAKRMQGLLCMIIEELQNTPLYYTVDMLFGRVHLDSMPMLTMRSAILNAGYDVSYSHASKVSLKTTAPAQLIWDIMRTWAQTHPAKPAKLEADSIAKYILNQEIKNTIDMSMHMNANPRSRQHKQQRFQVNPAPNWGPGARAVINIGENKMTKAKYNQNKKKNKERNAKRQHSSQSDEESRKKPEPDQCRIYL